jgi:hypothetical protein
VQHRRHHVLADPDLVLEHVAHPAALGDGREIERIEAGGRDVQEARPWQRRHSRVEIDADEDVRLGESRGRPTVRGAVIHLGDLGGRPDPVPQDGGARVRHGAI